jgi:uncharacterized membrane protein
MRSKATILGHPIHPMLIAFPVAFYTATLVGFIVYATSGDPFWLRLADLSNWAGVVMAGVAAIPGLLDWAVAIPAHSEAKKTGLFHMGLNVASLVVFLINAITYWNTWEGTPLPDAKMGVALSAIGVLLTLPAGFLGWSLVQDHHVGLNLPPGDARNERSTTPTREPPPAPTYGSR